MKLGSLWLSGGDTPATTVDGTLPLPFSSLTCGRSWHSVHCSRIDSPFSFRCLPLWQRKQPGESLCREWFGKRLPRQAFLLEGAA